MPRTVIIDDSLDRRLAGQLASRARPTVSLRALELSGLEDPDVLEGLAALDYDDWVLVTADDAMPWEHEAQLKAMAATVATVDGEWTRIIAHYQREDMGHEAFKCETVHRWVHNMVEQRQGTIYRYNPFTGGRAWTVRPRHKQRVQLGVRGQQLELTPVEPPPI